MKKVFLITILKGLVIVLLLNSCNFTVDLTKAPSDKHVVDYDLYIKENAPNENAFVAVQRIAEKYLAVKDWAGAIHVYKSYMNDFPQMTERFNKIIAILEAPDENLVVKNVGSWVNTPSSEYAPVISADGSRLYFTGYDRMHGSSSEDIFYSRWNGRSWVTANNIGHSINTKRKNESLDGISSDGTRLFLMGSFKGSFDASDIFYIDKTARGWGKIQHFPKPINTGYTEANAVASSDGKAVLFTSDRPGGVGKYEPKGMFFHGAFVGNVDIYVTIKTDTGWSAPINLGPDINTPYCEYSPFLHPDGKTLYFSSDGHPGLGRMDVFKSTRLDDNSWTSWSEPVNLGKQINTPGHDWGYKISTDGELAYFATAGKNDSYGKEDIYTITVPEKAKPQYVATITGHVYDESGDQLEAEIVWEDLKTGEEKGRLRSDPVDGSYFIVLPLGKNYGYYASKEGYYPESQNVNLTKQDSSIRINEDIVLNLLLDLKAKDEVILLNNIFFEFDKAELLPESYAELNRVVKFLMQNPSQSVEISGHTDNKGTNEYNRELSDRRAKAVVEYLVENGCNAENIVARGYGESKPVATNDTENGRAKNRRVEMKFLN